MQKARWLHLLMTSISLIVVSGCAFGHTVDYQNTLLPLSFSGDKTIAVAVHDQRPYVVSKESPVQYIGTTRGGYGNPFNALTESGKPLSDDIALSVAQALRKAGFNSVTLSLTPWENTEKAINQFKASQAVRLLLFTLKEWRTDTYFETFLFFNVTLQVFDRKSKELADSSIIGEKDMDGVSLDPGAEMSANTPGEYKEKFGKLLNDPKIQSALK